MAKTDNVVAVDTTYSTSVIALQENDTDLENSIAGAETDVPTIKTEGNSNDRSGTSKPRSFNPTYYICGRLSAAIVVPIIIGLSVGLRNMKSKPLVNPNRSNPADDIRTISNPNATDSNGLLKACQFLGFSQFNLDSCQSATSGTALQGGSIPTTIGLLTMLTSLGTHSSFTHEALTGTIPSTIGNLVLLNFLDLSNNKLIGSIPSTMGKLTQLTQLYLNDNGLGGTIPSSIGSLTRLTSLNVYNNPLLLGSVPSAFCGTTNGFALLARVDCDTIRCGNDNCVSSSFADYCVC
jgi:hypothetical protein